MDGQNHPLNGDAIDRSLQEALDVSPSSEFIARVRMRIANEPAPRGIWAGWTGWTGWTRWTITRTAVAAGAIVTAVVVMAVLVSRQKIDTTGPLESRTARATADVQLPAPSSSEGLARAESSGLPDTTRKVVASVSPSLGTGRATVVRRTSEPEVLVAQDEAAALRRLFARAGEGLVIAGSLVADSGPATNAAGDLPPDITIPPIRIEPLVPVNGEEGVRQ